MDFEHNKDPFKERQPEIEFLDELHGPVHTELPARWNRRQVAEGEVPVWSAVICGNFPDEEGVLETAYADFGEFLALAGVMSIGKETIDAAEERATTTDDWNDEQGLEGKHFIFRTALDEEIAQTEAYRITVTPRECVIESADTEGIRRALYYLEDEMCRREGNFLPLGEIYRYAVVKTRISRGFLNPNYQLDVKGELGDDTEYYTDNYLSRLAYAGINSLWTQEHFRVILPSELIPEYGWDSEARIGRLNRLVSRCKRYGIKVYLEGVEPASTCGNPALLKHPEMLGGQFGPSWTFCSSSESGKAYIRESCARLFELVPGLAGVVDITLGESVATCAAVEEDRLVCPRCRGLGLTRAQILADVEVQMLEAMQSVKPDAELISWAYAIRGWKPEEREEYFRLRDRRVTSLINFEDHGKVMQLDRERTAIDYWLSYTGPGKVFTRAAEVAQERKTPLYAKIQVCSSHEVSTVPYVPAPGLLYDKFKYMHEHGVSGAMYCWYFGNYPCMMNKAASELSFAPFPESKEAFLRHIAGIYWGEQSKEAAKAYLQLERGYTQYPVSMTFEWHGPMGDAPVWPLHLEPVDLPISQAYTNECIPGGDRVGEFILQGHTHAEALTLCEQMSTYWKEGVNHLTQLEDFGDREKKDQQQVAQALGILFESGTNILRFYDLRNRLGLSYPAKRQINTPKAQEHQRELLARMRSIVLEEMENSRRLTALCEQDKRLGYHSEAVAFKYFPEKLKWRINCLEKLLAGEFHTVEARIDAGEAPLPFFLGVMGQSHRYVTTASRIEDADWESFMLPDGTVDHSTQIRMSETEDAYYLQISSAGEEAIQIKAEFRMFHPYAPVKLVPGNAPELQSARSYGLFDEHLTGELAKWRVTEEAQDERHTWTICLNKQDFWAESEEGDSVPFRLAVKKLSAPVSEWERGKVFYKRLIFGTYSPDSYVFIIPREYS